MLSLFFQEIQGQSALQTGLSFFPMTALIAASNLAAPRLAVRMGSLAVIVLGARLLAAGLAAVLPSSASTMPDGRSLPRSFR